jgi:hypothetical protein
LQLFHYADDPETAMSILREGLTRLYLQPEQQMPEAELETPASSKSRI